MSRERTLKEVGLQAAAENHVRKVEFILTVLQIINTHI